MYVCANLYHSHSVSDEPVDAFSDRNRISLKIDGLLVVSTIIIGSLILTGVLGGLPTGVGTIGYELGLGLIGAGCSIVFVDLLVAILVTNRGPTLESKTEKISREILETPIYAPSVGEIRRTEMCPRNKILDCLYLGNAAAFVDAYHGRGDVEWGTIITMCPLLAIRMTFPQIDSSLNRDAIQTAFAKRGVTWKYIGKTAEDNKDYFDAFVFDNTYPETEEGIFQRSYTEVGNPQGINPQIGEAIAAKKERVIQLNPDVRQWFQYTFGAIREGMKKGNVLVHCQAGKSRSAGILTAFLAIEYNVTYELAENFVRIRRPCACSEFRESLIKYVQGYQALNQPAR